MQIQTSYFIKIVCQWGIKKYQPTSGSDKHSTLFFGPIKSYDTHMFRLLFIHKFHVKSCVVSLTTVMSRCPLFPIWCHHCQHLILTNNITHISTEVSHVLVNHDFILVILLSSRCSPVHWTLMIGHVYWFAGMGMVISHFVYRFCLQVLLL